MSRVLRPFGLVFVSLLVCIFTLSALAADPTFSNKTIKLGFSALDIVTGDFNRDGRPDVAVLGPSSVAVLIGNGDGTFRRADYASGEGGGQRLVVADFNGDKVPDLATSDKSGNLIILFGKGDGSFQNAFGYQLTFDGSVPDFTAADFDGDGKADLAYSLNNKAVLTFIGVGDGTFTVQKTVYTANWGAYSFTTGDFNGDGKPDILFADCCNPDTYYTGGYATVLFNQGGFNFTPNTDIGQVDFYNLTTTDFGHDGVSDFSLQFSGCHTPCAGIVVASGSRDGKLQSLLRLYINTDQQNPPAFARAGDFNGDGRDDLAYSMASNQGFGYPPVENHESVLFSLTGADGKPSESPIDINIGPGQRVFAAPMVAADFDNDGRPDIMVDQPDQQGLILLLNTTGKSVAPGDFQISVSPGSATITRGQAASFTLNIAPMNEFNAPVQLSCSGLPSGANCDFSANPAATSGGSINVNLNITTTAPTTASNSSAPLGWMLALALPFGFVAIATGSGPRRKYIALVVLVLALAVLLGLSACGGVAGNADNNNNNPSPGPTPTPTPSGGQGGTPAGNYTVTVTGAAGATQHATKITLNVQ
jgi:hypothetical protein